MTDAWKFAGEILPCAANRALHALALVAGDEGIFQLLGIDERSVFGEQRHDLVAGKHIVDDAGIIELGEPSR